MEGRLGWLLFSMRRLMDDTVDGSALWSSYGLRLQINSHTYIGGLEGMGMLA